MKKKLQVCDEKIKLGLISILLAACCLLTYYFHTILNTDLVFTHLFYIPIILAALWWQWKGFWVAIFLGAMLVFTRGRYATEPFYIYDCFRVLIFIFIAYFVIVLSRRITRGKKSLFTIVQNSPYGVAMVDQNDRHLYLNPEFTRITGYTIKDIPTKEDWVHAAYPDPNTQAEVMSIWRQVPAQDYVDEKFSIVCRDGDQKIIRFRAITLNDARVLLILNDITDRERLKDELAAGTQVLIRTNAQLQKEIEKHRQTENALRVSEERYRMLFEGSRDAIFIADQDAKFVDVNSAASILTGYSKQELKNMSVLDLHQGEDLIAYEHYFDRVMAGESITSEAPIFRRDQTKVDTEFSSRRFMIGNVSFMHTTARDITKRKQAEARLREIRATLQAAVDGISDALFMLDENLRIRMSNRAARAYYQLADSEEILGRSCFEVLKKKTKPCRGCKISSALKSDRRQTFERYSCTHPDRYVQIDCYPLEHEKELNISGTIVRICDITEQKQIEEQLLRADRLSSMGLLSAGIAHEIRNPLASISLYIDILSDKEKFEFSDQILEIFYEIKNNVNRMSGIIKQVLDFARPAVASRRQIDINDIIEETLKLWLSKIRKTEIALELTLDKSIPKLFGDAIQIQQVINNLILNALEAMTANGVLAVSTLRGKSSVLHHRDVLILNVSDTGCGIESNNLENIFNPFFTTKPLGTGLGLAITHRIVQRHGGIIRFKSMPGQTVFTVEMPIMREN